MKKLILIGMLVTVTIFAFATTRVHAQINEEPSVTTAEEPEPTDVPLVGNNPTSGIDLTLSPVFINLRTDPGEPVTSEIKIRNNSNTDEYLQIVLNRFEASADGSQPSLIDIDQNDPFLDWIEFSERQFQLAPNQTKTITFTITPSEDAALGYYYGLIFQRIGEGTNFAENQAVVSGAPAVSVLLEVASETTTRELQLLDFTTDKFFYEYLPTSFNVTVENIGNIHVVPAGDIFIDSASADEVGIIRINEGFGNVLPQSTRTFTATWNDAMIIRDSSDVEGNPIFDEDGNPKFKTQVDFTKAHKFRIGKYTATVLLVYDNGERDVPLEATVSFWVFPWKIILGATAVGLLAIVGLKSTIASALRSLIKGKKK